MAGVVCKAAGMAGTTGRYVHRQRGEQVEGRHQRARRQGPAQMSGRAGEEWVGMAKPPHGKNPAAICLDEAQKGAQ